MSDEDDEDIPESDDPEAQRMHETLDSIYESGNQEAIALVEEFMEEAARKVAAGEELSQDYIDGMTTKLQGLLGKRQKSDN